jgi:hypothetical protein
VRAVRPDAPEEDCHPPGQGGLQLADRRFDPKRSRREADGHGLAPAVRRMNRNLVPWANPNPGVGDIRIVSNDAADLQDGSEARIFRSKRFKQFGE